MPIPALTGRERLLRTLRREPVDRFPIDLGAHLSTGISAFAYQRLREHLGLSCERIEVIDPVQMLARVDEDVLQRFQVDVMPLRAGSARERIWEPRPGFRFTMPATFEPRLEADRSWVVERHGLRMRMPSGGFFFDGAWPEFDERSPVERLDALEREADRIAATGRGCLLICGLGGIIGDDPDWLMRAAEEPDAVATQVMALVERSLAWTGRLAERLGDRVQVVEVNGDLGSQRGPLISPKTFARIGQPALERMCRFIHEHTPWKVFLHSCGGIAPLIPGIVDAGVDILNPVQIAAAGMDPATLKARHGDRLVFWGGGCDTQHVLGCGTPDQVEADVRRLCTIFAANGGFVFNQVHNIMGDVPPENIVRMFDTAIAMGVPLSLATSQRG